MGELAFVVAQSGNFSKASNWYSLCFFALLILVLVLVWLVSRRIRRWFGRSLKAQQDLARATADVAERLERIESKLEEQSKAER
jgi:membrane protein implicated in regulation of membrane protease activity